MSFFVFFHSISQWVSMPTLREGDGYENMGSGENES